MMVIRKTIRRAQAWVLGCIFQVGREVLVGKDRPPPDSSVLLLFQSFYLIFRSLSSLPVPCLPDSSPGWLTLGWGWGSLSLRLPFPHFLFCLMSFITGPTSLGYCKK